MDKNTSEAETKAEASRLYIIMEILTFLLIMIDKYPEIGSTWRLCIASSMIYLMLRNDK